MAPGRDDGDGNEAAKGVGMKTLGHGKILKFEDLPNGQMEITGIVSSEKTDKAKEKVRQAAVLDALDQWGGNFREQHDGHRAVGKNLEYWPDVTDEKIPCTMTKMVVSAAEPGTQTKVREGILTGFSLGGDVLESKMLKEDGQTIKEITKIRVAEISLVDSPMNDDCKFVMVKAEDFAKADEPTVAPAETEEPAESPAAEASGVALLNQAREILCQFAAMEAQEISEEGASCLIEIAYMTDRLAGLISQEQMEAAMTNMELADKAKTLQKGQVSYKLDKEEMGKLEEMCKSIEDMGKSLSAMSESIKAFGAANSDKEKPADDNEPKDEAGAEAETGAEAEDKKKKEAAEKAAQSDTLQKAMGSIEEKLSAVLGAVEASDKRVSGLAKEFEEIRNRTVPGGPIKGASKMNKTDGAGADGAVDPIAIIEASISALPENQRQIARQQAAFELSKAMQNARRG